MTPESVILAFLAASLARPLILAATGWLLLRVLRVRHPASAHLAWTAVLAGMLLVPVASVMAPHWNVVVRAPHAAASSNPAAPVESDTPVPPAARASTPGPRLPSLSSLILWCYFAGLGAMACYRLFGVALLGRLVARSLRLKPHLRESGDILAPVSAGLLRPAVILPADWRGWEREARRAVLAHEFAHLRRGDTLVAAAGKLATCLFWFHPLSWWLSRKISELAEQACDAEAVRKTHDPAAYSRVLLHFADVVNGAGHRAALPGLAMSTTYGLGRRIDRIFEYADAPVRGPARPGLTLALAGVPVMCLAATIGLGEGEAAGPPTPPAIEIPVPPTVEQARPPQQVAGAGFLEGIGTAAAYATVTIRPQVDGQLMTVNFKEGDRVQAGEVIATIDARVFEARLQEAQSQMLGDEAQLQKAATELARYRQLAASNAISSDQLAAPAAVAAQLQAKVSADKAAIAGAELQVSKTKITSPITGVAGLRQIDPGNMVRAADATGIVTIMQLQPIAVLAQVPENLVPSVREALRQGPPPTVEAWNRDNSRRLATGRLMAIDNQIDADTGTAKLKAVFDNQDGALMPGQFLNVRVFVNPR